MYHNGIPIGNIYLYMYSRHPDHHGSPAVNFLWEKSGAFGRKDLDIQFPAKTKWQLFRWEKLPANISLNESMEVARYKMKKK